MEDREPGTEPIAPAEARQVTELTPGSFEDRLPEPPSPSGTTSESPVALATGGSGVAPAVLSIGLWPAWPVPVTSETEADPLPALPVFIPGATPWYPVVLELQLSAYNDHWDSVLPPASESFRGDTSLSRKGSVSVGEEQWDRVTFQSTRVDLTSGGRVSISADLAHQFPLLLAEDTPGREAPQPLRFSFKHAGDGWEYGVDHRSLQSRFERFADSSLKKDEAGTETWAAWRLGALRIRGFASQTWNNLSENPARDRTTQLLGGAGVELALPASTWLNLSYARGTAERSRDFVSATQRRRLGEIPRTSNSSLERLRASLYRWAETWDVSLSSSYTPSRDVDDPGQQAASLSQDLSVTLRPTEKIGSTVALSLWQEHQEWTGYRSEGGTASLSLWYGPFLEGHMLSMWGSYDRGRSNDGYWDTQSINTSATLSRRLGRTPLGNVWLSFELGYSLYLDAVYAANSTDELYGKIVLKMFDF
jgi:hypothetical protein